MQSIDSSIEYGKFTRNSKVHESVAIVAVILLVASLLIIWGRSWSIETEVRWMYLGVHRHLELAKGTVTFVTTSGCQSGNYFTWSTSPNLSYGRSGDWYKVSEPGEVRRYWRVHPVVTPIAAAAMLIGGLGAVRARRSRRGSGRD